MMVLAQDHKKLQSNISKVYSHLGFENPLPGSLCGYWQDASISPYVGLFCLFLGQCESPHTMAAGSP